MAHLRDRAYRPDISSTDASLLDRLEVDAAKALSDLDAMTGVRRFFSGAKRAEAARGALTWLERETSWFERQGVKTARSRLGSATTDDVVTLSTLLDSALGFAPSSRADVARARLVSIGQLATLPSALRALQTAITDEDAKKQAVRRAGERVRKADTRRFVASMPLDRLREATNDRLRLGSLPAAGYRTVTDVLDGESRLTGVPGIGPASARSIAAAAHELIRVALEEMPVRIDVTHKHAETTALLTALGAWDATRRLQGSPVDLETARQLAPLTAQFTSGVSHLYVAPARGGADVDELLSVVARVVSLAGSVSGTTKRGKSAVDPWKDFEARPSDYYALLSELGLLVEDENAVQGDLPAEIVEAIRRQPLDTKYLAASLRGYQHFAARFALVQKKVLIGDEMGLGKTVESLAVLAHLRSRGETHFLVVCPAAVVTNWMREVSAKSKLRPHRLHGPDRAGAARRWVRDGGVAVTTFETLRLWDSLAGGTAVACVVVDEAHYVKNPGAKRSIATAALVEQSARAILMSGTPLENRVDEFRNLVSYIRPDLTVKADDFSPREFRRQVAPAYLRRNQEDVLQELPPLVEVDEWLPMSATDLTSYRQAVAGRNFAAMRQAAMLAGQSSQKLERLVELVREAEANGRRVIVFSYFRAVLDAVAKALPGPVYGPLTGSVAANERQRMVDDFARARHGAVLVAQIVAGGVGLNIQAASMVVICEPQLKPTTEAQAVARAHRMGQLQSVQVHRLLSEEGVDVRVREILARKQQIFDDFARVSATADSTPEAVDISEADLAREVIEAERERLFSQDATSA
ncbi:DEAD/DEAH box helicase [Jannaschia sp. R86511]|uniref:DEAD/DEAH box helicase n=1 Tax=Jannaschia sp. R86511 TaxID=3093853 RepID=UPI0036D3A479